MNNVDSLSCLAGGLAGRRAFVGLFLLPTSFVLFSSLPFFSSPPFLFSSFPLLRPLSRVPEKELTIGSCYGSAIIPLDGGSLVGGKL